jgi:hypothetical protein
MTDPKDVRHEIYEWGELERDAERAAQFTVHGGLFYRFFRWVERIAREEREDLIEERDARD